MKVRIRILGWMMLAMVSWPTMAQTVFFQDGFENGLSTEWTQNFYDRSANDGMGAWVSEPPKNSQPWKTEKGAGLDYPDGAVVGQGRAYFRLEAPEGQHVQSSGYRTRLITPMMDLSRGYQPILRFYHAQAKWTADFDTLRVYYRKGEQGTWHTLREYTAPIAKWTFEEITLPLVGKDYQLAFEASENMGRGIVLDSVIIRTKPQITTPHDITYYDMRDNGMNLTWEASKDADYFRVVVSTKDLDLNVNPDSIESEAIVRDEQVESQIQDLRLTDLEGGRVYYVQIQSMSEKENSVWSDTYRFRMKPVVEIPYTEDFKLTFKSDNIQDQQLLTWCWGGDYQPFIPLSLGSNKYSYFSVDKSEAVVFPGTKNNTTSDVYTKAIAEGMTSWLVSPEISGKSIQNFSLGKCHVTFWGTTYTFQQDKARSIIVGAMIDPEDITTFVPIDTCTVWGYQTFTYFDVDLSSYTGEGRYVAFVSNFAGQTNWFALDKVTIAERKLPRPVVPSEIRVIPTTTTAAMSWPQSEGATGYKVKFQALSSKSATTPLYATSITAATRTATTNSIDLSGLNKSTKYAISVQAVNGTASSEWSQPKAFYTSPEKALPMNYGFEASEGTYSLNSINYLKDWCYFSNDAVTPYCYNSTSYRRNGSCCLYGVTESSSDVWMTLPYVADLTQVEMIFYMRTTGTTYIGSSVDVGVMTDPADLRTFDKIGNYIANDVSYQKYYANFTNYKGSGKYIAIRWGNNGNVKNAVCIDDLTIKQLASCFAPSLNITDVTDSSAVIAWDKQEVSYTYDVKVNSTSIAENSLETKDGDTYNAMGTTLDRIDLTELRFATTYYVYIRTHCSSDDHSDWACTQFTTTCPDMMQLPYSCNFDNDKAGSGLKPSCWIPAYMTSSTAYPYISTTYRASGNNSLYMPSTSTTASFISLPKIDADLDKVIVRYKAYCSTANYQVIVGVMEEPSNYKCFEAVDTLTITTASRWTEHKTMLLGQKGREKHIAFTTYNGKSNTIYLDDVQVTDITDAPPFNYTKTDAGTDWIEAGWEGITSEQWQVVVTSKFYPLNDDDTFDPSVIAQADKKGEALTADASYKVSGLSPQTWYYFYARSTASEEWSMDSLQTECTTWNPSVAVSEGFEIGKTATTSLQGTNDSIYNFYRLARIPQCWTVGNARGVYAGQATSYTMRNYWPYICSNGAITTLGSLTNYYDKGTALTTNCFSYAGYNTLKLYGYYSSSETSNYAPAYAAMNQLECSDKDLQQLTISGYYQMTNTSGCALIVGVMDDPTDLSTFFVLDSITAGNGTGVGKSLFFEVSMEDYTGKGRYIAFRTPKNKTTTIYLDDICVTAASCPAPKPALSQITDVSVVLASGLKVDNGWTYIVTSEPYSTQLLDKGERPDPSIIVKQGSLLQEGGDPAAKRTRITGLTADTTYYVYVATICGEQYSAWRQTKFSTLCPPVDVTTWMEGFESYATGTGQNLGCWTMGCLNQAATVTYVPYVMATSRKELGKALTFYCTSTYSGGYAISPGLKIPNGKSLNDYMICFYGYGTSSVTGATTTTSYEHNLRVGVVTDPSDPSTMVVLDTISLETKTRINHVLLDGLQVETGKTYYLFFLLERDYNTYARAVVDSICLKEIPACRFPTSISVDDISYTSAKVTWTGSSSSYQLALAPRELTDAEKDSILSDPAKCAKYGIRLQTVKQNSAQVTGLTANTRYFVYVQGICGTSRSDWSYEYVYFKTDCAPTVSVPFSDNFDHYMTYGAGYQPDCYYGYQDKGSSTSTTASYGPKYYPYAHNTTGYNSAHSVYFYAINTTSVQTHCILTVPALDASIDKSTLQINFWSRRGSKTASYNAQIVLGMVRSLTDVGTFVPLDTLNMTDLDVLWHYQEYNLNLSKYQKVLQKGYSNFAFYMPTPARPSSSSTYNQLYLDNLKIIYIPTCYLPKNVQLKQVGFNSARIQFTPAVASDDEWDILLTETETGKTSHYTAHDTIATLTGLKHSTSYTIQVRTVCGDNDYSEYTDAVSFNTKWVVDTYKWTFNLNEQGTTSVPTMPAAAVATYALHPGLTADATDTTYRYSAPQSYLPYQIFNSTTYAYATDPLKCVADGDSARAMQFYTSAVYDSATIILPYVVNAQQKQLSFDVRSGYAYVSDHSTDTYRNVVSNTWTKATITIGVVDSMCGIETFKALTTWRPSPLYVGDTLRQASNYGWDHVVLPLSSYNLQGKQLALMMCGCGIARMYVDNMAIEKTANMQTPYITTVDVGDTYATIHWTGMASKYNVYLVDTTRVSGLYPRYLPYLQDANSGCIVQKKNVTGNSYTFTELTENTTYAFYVEDASNASKTGALSNRKIATTVCAAIDARGWSCDFEPGPGYVNGGSPAKSTADGFTWQWPTSTTSTDTVYKTPECWQVGSTDKLYDPTSTTYKTVQPTMTNIYSTSGTTSVGWDNSYALAFTGSAAYKEAYAVLPLFGHLDMDTAEVCFVGRCAYVYSSTKKLTTFISTVYSTSLAVGTMTDPTDPSTFVPLDTVTYDYISNDISSSNTPDDDPMGMQFFQKMTVPLKGAKGSYIAFRQVGNGFFYMDNLCIQKRQTARHPRDLRVITINPTSVQLGWRNMEEGGQYVVELSTSYGDWTNPVKTVTVTTNQPVITGLLESQTYYYRVKQINTAYGDSRFAHQEQFTTSCQSKSPNGFYTGFEGTSTDEEMSNPKLPATYQNRCWQYLQRTTTTTTSYWPQNIGTANGIYYAHSGSKALKLYSYVSSNKLQSDPYVVLPKIEAEVGKSHLGFDTLQLVFWACPAPHNALGKTTADSKSTDAKCVEIGCCSDPDDLSTYTVLEKWYYKADNNTLAKGSIANSGNDYAFQKATIKLNKVTAPYIYLRATVDRGDNVGYTASTLYIDDLCFERLTSCDEPTEMDTKDITCSRVTLTWKSEANNFDVDVSRDPTFTDEQMHVVSKTNLTTNQLQVTGLQPQTTYYFRVKAYCDAARKNLSGWSQNAVFRTPYAPLYQQQFTSSEFANEDGWMAYSGYADKVFAGLISPTLNSSTGTYNSWQQVQNIAFSGYAMRLQLYYTTNSESYWQKYWLVSPGIAIEGDSAQLVFNLAQTYYKASATSTAASKDVRTYEGWDQGWDDQFMMIISDDNGRTWRRENAVIWNNETSNDAQSAHYRYGKGDYSLRALTTTPQQYTFDLSKYAGKTIQVAFYGENTEQNCQTAVHVDNFHVNYLTSFEQSLTRCQFEDVDDVLGFTISGDSVAAGDTTFIRSSLSINPGENDSLVTLHVHYDEAPIFNELITVCKGTPFKYKDFNEHSAEGTYRMKLTSQVTGCDSIVNLTIRHTVTYRTTIDTTLCFGTPFVVGDSVYTSAGFHRDTLSACEKMGGCDSIVELTLRYSAQSTLQQTHQVCKGESWYWPIGDTLLSTTGVYQHNIPKEGTCDSVIVMTFTAIEPVVTMFEDSIRDGEAYAFGGKWFTTAGTYSDSTKSEVTGCDSISILNLKVVGAPIIYTRDTICDGASLQFGKQLLKEAGTYWDTVADPKTGIKTITQLILTIRPKSSSSMGVQYLKPGQSFSFFGRSLTTTGTYYETLTAASGCDSVVSVSVLVLGAGSGSEEKSVCEKDMPYTWKDTIVCQKAGIYPCTIHRAGQADSTVYLILTVVEVARGYIEDSICLGGQYVFGSRTLTTPGTYYDTIKSAVTGCDSIVVLTLVQQALDVRPRTVYLCDGDSMLFRGYYISVPAIYYDTVSDGDCQYVDELTLRKRYPVVATLNQRICQGDSLIFNGEVLRETCNREMISKSLVTGCDSITKLALQVMETTFSTLPARICKGDTFYLGNRPLTESGSYYDTLKSETGCDSIVSLLLTVNQPQHVEISDTICHGLSYFFGNRQLTKSGTYYDTILDANRCQEIHTLHLTVNPVGHGVQTAAFCKSYTYQGKVYTTPGVYDVAFVSELGCDTMVTLNLTQSLDAHDTTRVTICQGERYEDEDFIVWSNGKYEAKIFEDEGCILTRILYLNVVPTIAYVDTLINPDWLPYNYYSISYPAGTPEGIYTDTIDVMVSPSCPQTVFHTLTIQHGVGLREVSYGRSTARKVLYRDQLYIVKDDKWYDITGTPVHNPSVNRSVNCYAK